GFSRHRDLVAAVSVEVAGHRELRLVSLRTAIEVRPESRAGETHVSPSGTVELHNPEVIPHRTRCLGRNGDLVVAISIKVTRNGESGSVIRAAAIEIKESRKPSRSALHRSRTRVLHREKI